MTWPPPPRGVRESVAWPRHGPEVRVRSGGLVGVGEGVGVGLRDGEGDVVVLAVGVGLGDPPGPPQSASTTSVSSISGRPGVLVEFTPSFASASCVVKFLSASIHARYVVFPAAPVPVGPCVTVQEPSVPVSHVKSGDPSEFEGGLSGSLTPVASTRMRVPGAGDKLVSVATHLIMCAEPTGGAAVSGSQSSRDGNQIFSTTSVSSGFIVVSGRAPGSDP